jgi:selenocysteine lyase/cysteine desulfurase
VNLQEIDPDSYSTSAHKWLMGPLEAGLLYLRAERMPHLWPSIVTAGWAENLKGARKFEVFGQRDDPRVAALESALDFVMLIGMPAVEARIRALATHTKTQLVSFPNVELKTNVEPALSGGVIKFRLRNVPTKRAYDTLWERHRISIAMTASGESEGLRLSPHIYNSIDQIDRALAAVRTLG